MISTGLTKVLCSATVEERVPPFRKGGGLGWVTASTRCCRAAPRPGPSGTAARGGSTAGPGDSAAHRAQPPGRGRLLGARGALDPHRLRRARRGRWHPRRGDHRGLRGPRPRRSVAAGGEGGRPKVLRRHVAAVSAGIVVVSRDSTSATSRTPPRTPTSTASGPMTGASSRSRGPRRERPSVARSSTGCWRSLTSAWPGSSTLKRRHWGPGPDGVRVGWRAATRASSRSCGGFSADTLGAGRPGRCRFLG